MQAKNGNILQTQDDIHTLDRFQDLRDFWIECFFQYTPKNTTLFIDLSIKYTATNKLGILEVTLTIVI